LPAVCNVQPLVCVKTPPDPGPDVFVSVREQVPEKVLAFDIVTERVAIVVPLVAVSGTVAELGEIAVGTGPLGLAASNNPVPPHTCACNSTLSNRQNSPSAAIIVTINLRRRISRSTPTPQFEPAC
jgi:hypothetical protein